MLNDCYTIQNNYRHFDFIKCLNFLNQIGKSRYGKSFGVRKEDIYVIHKLIVYAIREEDLCKKYGLDIEKGILLIGPVGCGKTSLITLLKEFMYPDQLYQVKSTRDIAAEFHKEGYDAVLRYGHRKTVLCLDDLGVENAIKHFGNECNTVAEILLQRYELFVNSHIVTHATTNLNANELEEIYGNRVRSRLRGMFNLVSFAETSKDKRK